MADITGPSEIKFVEQYLRPMADATINFHDNYLIPFQRMWVSQMAVTGGGDYSLFSDSFTGGFSSGLVHDGFSSDHFFKVNGEKVYSAMKAIENASSEIELHKATLIRVAARAPFSTETIDLRQSTTGTGGWIAE
jgi:hypothetical protein